MARERVLAFGRHYLFAVQFFTRLPLSGELANWVGFTPGLLRASVPHWPGVGWLTAVAACSVFTLLSVGLPATSFTVLAAAVGATICTVALTGALHEDGLADLADGLGGSADRARALAIMKDSRIGTFGAMAVVLVLLAKVALIALLGAVSPATVVAAILGAHVASRFLPLLLTRTLDHVGGGSLSASNPLASRLEPADLGVAAAWCVVPLAIAVGSSRVDLQACKLEYSIVSPK